MTKESWEDPTPGWAWRSPEQGQNSDPTQPSTLEDPAATRLEDPWVSEGADCPCPDLQSQRPHDSRLQNLPSLNEPRHWETKTDATSRTTPVPNTRRRRTLLRIVSQLKEIQRQASVAILGLEDLGRQHRQGTKKPEWRKILDGRHPLNPIPLPMPRLLTPQPEETE